MLSDDVFLCSLPKRNTTWMHNILFLMLHGINDAGEQVKLDGAVVRDTQLFLEACPFLPPITLEEADEMEK